MREDFLHRTIEIVQDWLNLIHITREWSYDRLQLHSSSLPANAIAHFVGARANTRRRSIPT